jgi:hypothetical protein
MPAVHAQVTFSSCTTAFKPVLENGVWTINGTLHCPDGKGGATTMCVGGTAEVELSKTDGRILKMIHYK